MILRNACISLLSFQIACATASATVYNSDGSSSDFAAKVALCASSGDTVTIPAGSFTWTTGVTVSGKSITVTGAGVDVTTITNNLPGGGRAMFFDISGGRFITLSGITFNQTTTYTYGNVSVGTP